MAEFNVEGWPELKAAFQNLPDNLMKSVLRSALRDGANFMKDEIRERCPVDTGALRDSVRVVARRGTPTRVVFQVVAGAPFTEAKQAKYGIKAPFYALFVERGTVHAPPHPFMRPAIEAGSGATMDRVVQGLSDRLPEVVG